MSTATAPRMTELDVETQFVLECLRDEWDELASALIHRDAPSTDPWTLEARIREAARAGDDDLLDDLILEACIIDHDARTGW